MEGRSHRPKVTPLARWSCLPVRPVIFRSCGSVKPPHSGGQKPGLLNSESTNKSLTSQPRRSVGRWSRSCVAIRKRVRWGWSGASKVFHKHGEQTHLVSQSWPLEAAASAVFGGGTVDEELEGQGGHDLGGCASPQMWPLTVTATQTGSCPCSGATPDPAKAPRAFRGPGVAHFHIFSHYRLGQTL